MKLNIPPHIKRLLLAFAVFIGLFIIVRSFLYPESFGEYGYYRGNTLLDVSKLEVRYAGNASCIECHKDISEAKKTDLHGDINCESCHGAGIKHTLNPDSVKLTLPQGREFCSLCHAKNAARSADVIVQVDTSKHNIQKNCTECHNPHMPWDVKQ